MVDEKWLPVVGYEDLYEVSSHGRVRSLDRVVEQANRWGGISKRAYVGRELSPSRHSSGHRMVKLFRQGDSPSEVYVHVLVLTAFVGPCPEGQEGCHNNGVPGDNRLSNLRWDTHSNNLRDAVVHRTNHNTKKDGCPKCNRPFTLRENGWRTCKPCTNKASAESQAFRRDLKKLLRSYGWVN